MPRFPPSLTFHTPRDIWVVRQTRQWDWQGPAMVHWIVGGSPWHTLCHIPGPPQMLHTSDSEGWPVGCLHAGGCGGGACGFPNPYRGGHVTGRGPRAPGGVGYCPAYPWLTRGSFWPGWHCQTRGDGSYPQEWGGYCCLHQDFPDCWLSVQSHPLEDADTPMGIPRGAWLDLNSLGSAQIVTTRYNKTGKLEYHCKARGIFRMSLCVAPPYIPGQSGTNWELKDQSVSKLLLISMKNLELSEYPLRKTDQDPNKNWFRLENWTWHRTEDYQNQNLKLSWTVNSSVNS